MVTPNSRAHRADRGAGTAGGRDQGSAQNRANLYAKPFASHETAAACWLATSCGQISLVVDHACGPSLVLDHDMGCVGGDRSKCDLDYVLGLAKHRVQRFDYS